MKSPYIPAALAVTLTLASCANPPASPDPTAPPFTPDPAQTTDSLTALTRPPVQGSLTVAAEPAPDRRQVIRPPQRQPSRPEQNLHRLDYNAPDSPTLRSQSTCPATSFQQRGEALVQVILAATTSCLNTLFSLEPAQARATFTQDQMVTAATKLSAMSRTYQGVNNGAEQLILFLRAGYFQQFYHPDVLAPYGAPLKTAVQNAIVSFTTNPTFEARTDAHGEVLSEFITLLDSAGENTLGLNAITRVLDRAAPATDGYGMNRATNAVFTVLFRGHYLPDFQQAVKRDPAITRTLADFTTRNITLLGTEREYLLANASRELARFVQYPTLQDGIRPALQRLLSSTGMTGRGASVWLSVAELTDHYGLCSTYGVCGFRERLDRAVLTVSHTCSPTLRIRAQALTADQLRATCTSLTDEETYFHRLLTTGGQPVPGDQNAALELVVFNSSADYQTYGSVIYGVDTNNGGLYLEGDPSRPGNQPRFLAYRAEWKPGFEIWNLNHEYAHYLDGRFNLAGDFAASTSEKTVWWIEGLAEYVSYTFLQRPYDAALAQARQGTFRLSDLLRNDYNSGSARVYNGGYLATRYMFEPRPDDVRQLLMLFRAGQYPAATTLTAPLVAGQADAAFTTWGMSDLQQTPVPTLPPAGPPVCTGRPDQLINCQRNLSGAAGDPAYHFTFVPEGTQTLTLQLSGGTGDADLYYSPSRWASKEHFTLRSATTGNAEQIILTNPRPGYHYVTVQGATNYRNVTLSAVATAFPTQLPECRLDDARAYQSGCARTSQSRTSGLQYAYVTVPAGTDRLIIRTNGGTGNADLYYHPTRWASPDTFTQSSVKAGNDEEITVDRPAPGLHFFTVRATAAYQGLTISVR